MTKEAVITTLVINMLFQYCYHKTLTAQGIIRKLKLKNWDSIASEALWFLYLQRGSEQHYYHLGIITYRDVHYLNTVSMFWIVSVDSCCPSSILKSHCILLWALQIGTLWLPSNQIFCKCLCHVYLNCSWPFLLWLFKV